MRTKEEINSLLDIWYGIRTEMRKGNDMRKARLGDILEIIGARECDKETIDKLVEIYPLRYEDDVERRMMGFSDDYDFIIFKMNRMLMDEVYFTLCDDKDKYLEIAKNPLRIIKAEIQRRISTLLDSLTADLAVIEKLNKE